jgi:putative transposase
MKKGKRAYPDDLSDAEWAHIEPLTRNKGTKGGRKPKYGKREMLNAIFLSAAYGLLLASLTQWFPTMENGVHAILHMKVNGFFSRNQSSLKKDIKKKIRSSNGTQCRNRGYPISENNGARRSKRLWWGEKIKGRKRHILVDTQGLLLAAQVTEANLNNRQGLSLLLEKVTHCCQKLKKSLGRYGVYRPTN